ncbi:MAG: YbjQ family protein, partial [Proteobacteria bacterium]|nr:YbjQ family protein [Pseudomonadota bacterium]
MGNILLVFFLLIIGYLFGNYREKQHFKSLQQREKNVLHLSVATFGSKQVLFTEVTETKLVVGNVVISIDYFKKISAMLRNLVGGKVI